VIGRNIGGIPAVRRALSGPSGAHAGLGLDGEPQLPGWRQAGQPLGVGAGQPRGSIPGLWRTQAPRSGARLLALIVFTFPPTLFLAHEIGRRALAEDKLEELATTDALTGLRNRRKFDTTIDSEWHRALRHQTALSLLMIDADHFKAYNDTFGHQAGDQVLV